MEQNQLYHFIDNCWISSRGDLLESRNPANGVLLSRGANATQKEVDLAFEAAYRALPSWSLLNNMERIVYLERFAKIVTEKKEDLSHLIGKETGKPLWEARMEVSLVINKVNLSIQAQKERQVEKITPQNEFNACLRYKPQGVVAVLGAFNFPAHLSHGHIIPALLAGNTVIYKPSELAPSVAQLIMICWQEAQLPAGVINCIQGGKESAQLLLSTEIQGVYFTGSYATGRKIHQQFAGKPEVLLALEMGGSNPLIIGEIKNVHAAIYYTLVSTLMTSGQRCTCARRLLIPNNKQGDNFLSMFISACKTINIGPYDAVPEPFMGPVISFQQALIHLKKQEELINLGGSPLLKMSMLKKDTGFLSPGILDMTRVNDVPDEEIFAPFVQVYRYQHFKEALILANNTRYGLAAGLLSENLEHYHQFYQTIRAGVLSWNKPTIGALGSLPFGGVGCSGNYRPSAYFAGDYCAYPIASVEQSSLDMPIETLPGIDKEFQ